MWSSILLPAFFPFPFTALSLQNHSLYGFKGKTDKLLAEIARASSEASKYRKLSSLTQGSFCTTVSTKYLILHVLWPKLKHIKFAPVTIQSHSHCCSCSIRSGLQLLSFAPSLHISPHTQPASLKTLFSILKPLCSDGLTSLTTAHLFPLHSNNLKTQQI